MNIIWHGTAALEIKNGDDKILFDPFIPLKGADWEIPMEDYDGFKNILVTHGHFDHIVNLPEIIERNPLTVIHCTEAPYKTLRKKGVPEKNLSKINYGEHLEIGSFSIDVYHSKHAVLPKADIRRLTSIFFNKNIGNLAFIARENKICVENDETVLYMVHAGGKTITICGSLNLREDCDYPTESDLLVLPYNGWDDNFPPAVRMIERLKPKKVFLSHWDNTFPPITSYVDRSPIINAFPGLIFESKPKEQWMI